MTGRNLITVLMCLVASVAQAGERTVVIWADQDTMVIDDPPNVPQGDRTRVDCSHGPLVPIPGEPPVVRRQGLFHFNVDFIPPGSEVVWASFEFPTFFTSSFHLTTGQNLGEPIVQLACAPVVWDEQTTWSQVSGPIQGNWVSVSFRIGNLTEFDDAMTRAIVQGWVNGIQNDGIVVSPLEGPINVDLWSCSTRETGIGGAPVLWIRYSEPPGGGGGPE